MKYSLINHIAAVLVFSVAPVLLLGETGEVAKSSNGSEFLKLSRAELIAAGVKDPEKFGEAWKDPSGMIWGDLAKAQDGSFLMLRHIDAEAYCQNLGGRLPTGWSEDFTGRHGFPKHDSDFVRLRKYLGAEPLRGYSAPKNYKPEVLPNLTASKNGKEYYVMIWSSSLRPYRIDLAFLFSSTNGIVFDNTRFYYAFPFRCVVGPSEESPGGIE